MMVTLLQDLKYGLRMLARNPGFTAVAVLTLALGIGANAAIFSVVNGLFLRGLQVQDPGALVTLGFTHKKDVGLSLVSYPDFEDIQRQANRWVDLFAYRFGVDGLNAGDRADHILTNYVTGDYFTALGTKPALGRLILPSEGKVPGADPVIVLAYSCWKTRFGGDPSVIGKAVRIDGYPVTIVGVAQKGFRGALSEVDIQAYLPLNMTSIEGFGGFLTDRSARALFALGRLRPGVTLQQARASMNVIATRLSQQYPNTDLGAAIWVLPQKEAALNPLAKPGEYQQVLTAVGLFLALAILVLFLACFNVANVLLVRATTREHEMAVRAALGAPGHRLMRQLLTESSLLALFGCVAGIVAGSWGSSLLRSIHFTASLPISLDFSFDWRVFAYAVGVATLAGFMVGVVPALRASRVSPGNALHEGGRSVAGGRHHLRNILVVAQVAGSIVLLIVAGLFTRSLQRAQRMDLGFNPARVLNLTMDPHEAGFNEAQGREFYKNLLLRVQALPGVQSASLAFSFPTGQFTDFDAVYVEGHFPRPGEAPPTIAVNPVSPGYFTTMQIPILSGRAFLDSDTAAAPGVAVINQSMAHQLWPDEDALGRRFRMNGESGRLVEVVGIARDSKYLDLFAKATPYIYLPLAQYYISSETLQIRTEAEPESVIRSVEEQVHSLAPGLPVFGVETMEQALNGGFTGFYSFRLAAYLAAALGILGLILAIVGVYGVISYSMSQRTHEIGIRMALGAPRRDIWRTVLGQGLGILALGGVIGILAALGLTRAMASFLYGVNAHDPLTYLAVTFLISAVTLLACYIPARRATKIDPMEALRYE
ncbi:MAG: ABC transporter permease [Terriglobia bacterium]|jgi:predicted permease